MKKIIVTLMLLAANLTQAAPKIECSVFNNNDHENIIKEVVLDMDQEASFVQAIFEEDKKISIRKVNKFIDIRLSNSNGESNLFIPEQTIRELRYGSLTIALYDKSTLNNYHVICNNRD